MENKYCETCMFNVGGYCTNVKLNDGFRFTDEESQDMLIYSYEEGGAFWVGPKFGCVHHKKELSNDLHGTD